LETGGTFSVSARATVLVNPISVLWAQKDSNDAVTLVRSGSLLSIRSGGSLAMSVVASGTLNPKYQWRLNGTPITGATLNAYTAPSMSAADAGVYDVVVKPGDSSITNISSVSTGRRVDLIKNILLDVGGQARTVLDGGSLQLSVQVKDGTPPYSFRWKRDGVPVESGSLVSGETSDTLTVRWGAFAQGGSVSVAGSYSVVVNSRLPVMSNGTVSSWVSTGNEAESEKVWIRELRKPAKENFKIVPSVVNQALTPGVELKLTVSAADEVGAAALPPSARPRPQLRIRSHSR
jgi:hypothetical protein